MHSLLAMPTHPLVVATARVAVVAGVALLASCATGPSPAETQRREHRRVLATVARMRDAVEKEMASYGRTAVQDASLPDGPAITSNGTLRIEGFGAPVTIEQLQRNCASALSELRAIEQEALGAPASSPLGRRMLLERAEAAIVRTLTGVAYANWQLSGSMALPTAKDLDILSLSDHAAPSR